MRTSICLDVVYGRRMREMFWLVFDGRLNGILANDEEIVNAL